MQLLHRIAEYDNYNAFGKKKSEENWLRYAIFQNVGLVDRQTSWRKCLQAFEAVQMTRRH